MDRIRLVLTTAALLGLSLTAPAWGQTDSSSRYAQQPAQQESPTLVGRLNQLGRTIFHSSDSRQSASRQSKPSSTQRHLSSADRGESPSKGLLQSSGVARRVGSVLGKSERGLYDIRPSDAVAEPEEVAEFEPPAASGRSEPPVVAEPQSPIVAETETPAAELAEPAVHEPEVPAEATSTPEVAAEEEPGETSVSPPRFDPLYVRLRAFQQSAFGQHATRGQAAVAGVEEATDRPAQTKEPAVPLKTRVSAKSATIRDKVAGVLKHEQPEAKLQNPMAGQLVTPEGPIASQVTDGPPVEQPESVEQPASQAPASATAQASAPAQPTVDENVVGVAEAADAVLFQRQSPVLRVETHGPRRIMVGKESTYELVVGNSGSVAANELAVTVELPSWAEVAGAETRVGTVQSSPSETGSTLEWKVGRLEAKTDETLSLRLVPRQSRPFDLGVRWTFTPAASSAEIEVQEPKLAIKLGGPRDVLHGKPEVYRLELANVGTGAAENLQIELTPVGEGENVAASHKLGTLPAGESRAIEIELTAQHAGELTIDVNVDGDNGLHAELSEKVVVRQAVLGVQVDGPKLAYVGTSVTYRVAVNNRGDAPASKVHVSATLPPGADMVTPSDGGQISRDGKTVDWTIPELAATDNKILLLKCNLVRPGTGQIDASADAGSDLAASDAIQTRVEAIADLVMSVVDPSGPVPVGQDAVYKVRIQNRGTKAAENVEAVGYFSQGIEPINAEGAVQTIAPGQVTFGPIPSIPASGEQVLTVTARAGSAGNHVFRAEVYCRALGTRLVSEQTTRYYGDDEASYTAARPGSAEAGSSH